DDPGNRGLLSDEMHPPSAMRARLMQADAAGLQLRVHAIGDRAISMVLDIFADIEKEHGYHDQRFAIEHAQHTAQKDFERSGKLADMVIVSDNIFELKPEAIRNVKVKITIVGGKVVYGER